MLKQEIHGPWYTLLNESGKYANETLHKCSMKLYHIWYQFWKKCSERPQNDIGQYKVKYTPYMWNACYSVQIFNPFCCMANNFWVTAKLNKSTDWHHNNIDHYEVQGVPHIWYTSSKFQNFSFYKLQFPRYFCNCFTFPLTTMFRVQHF